MHPNGFSALGLSLSFTKWLPEGASPLLTQPVPA